LRCPWAVHRVLRITNGICWNGLVIYASDKSPLAGWVLVEILDGLYIFQNVSEPGGHSTYRIFLEEGVADHEFVRCNMGLRRGALRASIKPWRNEGPTCQRIVS
jgi:hypothetical protein